ncbi:MAG: GDSL family lipase [Gemmataceae bacterium]|nr:GDSL family lipase [Gemmataceae bacterium]
MKTAIRTVLAGLALACSFGPLAAREEDKPNPAATKTKPFNMKRHQTFLKRIADSKAEGDVVFYGDSITQGWEGNKKAWEAFKEFKPVNLGISGEQTGHVLWRITEGKELADLKPKAAVIMIGTNNTGRHTAEQIAGGIKAIVEELKKQKPEMKILLLGVFPRAGKGPGKGATMVKKEDLAPKIKQINDLISKLDDGKTVFYKDIGEKFLDADGNLPKDVMPDYLHLSAKGYQIWADAIKDDLAKLAK